MYRIIAVGKIKEKYLSDGIKEYEKRIQWFTNFQITEVKEVNTKEVSRNIKQEGENILKEIKNDEFVIALCIDGQVMDSEGLAQFLASKALYGTPKLPLSLVEAMA